MRILICLCAAIRLAEGADFSARFEAIVRSATSRELYAFLWDLPKGGDIHNHSALSIPAESWLEMATNPAIASAEFYTRIRFEHCPGDAAPVLRFRTIHAATWRKLDACVQREYVPLRSLNAAQRADWISSIRLDRKGEARNEFFEAIVPRVGELPRDPRLMAELLVANLKRYGSEGLRYLETQYNPTAMAPDGSVIPPDQAAELLRKRLEQPDVLATGVTARFQVTVLRFSQEAERAIETSYEFLDRNRDLWVGLNLAGREDNDKGHALRFLDTFRGLRRRYSGIHLSIHAGEKDAPGREVRNTLLLGAERIGHGTNLIHDPDTMLLMRNGRTLVEVSLVSNRLLEYTPDLSRHPFIEYLRFGIPVCLNTDDPGSWDSNLTDEYVLAIRNFRLTWEEVVRLGRNSLQYSFAQSDVKARMLREYETATAAFEKKYSGDWKAALAGVRPQVSGYAARELGITNSSSGAAR